MKPQFQSIISQLADKKSNESLQTNPNQPQKNKLIASRETELSKAGLVNVNQGVKEVINYDKNILQNQIKGTTMPKSVKAVNESSTIKIPMSVIIESGILDTIKKAVKPKTLPPKPTQPLDQDESKQQMANEFKKLFS
jgi:hypothetical protein